MILDYFLLFRRYIWMLLSFPIFFFVIYYFLLFFSFFFLILIMTYLSHRKEDTNYNRKWWFYQELIKDKLLQEKVFWNSWRINSWKYMYYLLLQHHYQLLFYNLWNSDILETISKKAFIFGKFSFNLMKGKVIFFLSVDYLCILWFNLLCFLLLFSTSMNLHFYFLLFRSCGPSIFMWLTDFLFIGNSCISWVIISFIYFLLIVYVFGIFFS